MKKSFMGKIFFLIIFEPIIIFGLTQIGNAYQIKNLSDGEVKGDIILSPSKIEIFLEPGESTNREIIITNQTGETIDFTIETEDFKGSRDPDETVIFLENEKGPYSLRDWLKPEIREFTLNHGERMYLPIEVSIPSDAEPGGRYGVVFALAKPKIITEATKEKNKSQEMIIPRVGTLFFVRIKGEVKEAGFLKEFKSQKKYYEKGPISFQLLFENDGNVHIVPYGIIEIFNFLGKKVEEIEINPYFAMPDSLRLREVGWDKGFLFGKYRVLASINRGYQDIIDQKSIEFWAIPWKIILAGVIGFFFLILFLRWIILKPKMINPKILKNIIISFLILIEFSFLPLIIKAQEISSSTNYRILDSSINVGGRGSFQTSTNYQMRETIGEIATGISTSTSFKLHAGYQEMQETYLSLSVSTSSVTLLPEISFSQNVATGTFSVNIITDNLAGYSLYVRASTSPALQSDSNSFADYTPSASSVPDYNWSIPATTSEFGFTPEGTQILQKYKDNGVDTCNIVGNDTLDRCWYNLYTTNETISKSNLANHPSGTQTTIKLKVESGSENIQAAGTYKGTIIITTVAN